MDGEAAGDRTEQWRASYRRVRKDPLVSSRITNRRRLASVGAHEIDRGGRWLDVGAGDGNLFGQLQDVGAGQVVMVEYQFELVREAPGASGRVAGSIVRLPVRSASVDVAVVMDVLHHVNPDDLRPALRELHRVIRAGGHLLIFEPAATWVRRALTAVLLSPASSLTRFSRDKRRMVEMEADTLVPWLRVESELLDRLGEMGFTVERRRRGLLHGSYRVQKT